VKTLQSSCPPELFSIYSAPNANKNNNNHHHQQHHQQQGQTTQSNDIEIDNQGLCDFLIACLHFHPDKRVVPLHSLLRYRLLQDIVISACNGHNRNETCYDTVQFVCNYSSTRSFSYPAVKEEVSRFSFLCFLFIFF
jgi:hypothetical protein